MSNQKRLRKWCLNSSCMLLLIYDEFMDGWMDLIDIKTQLTTIGSLICFDDMKRT